MKRLAVAVTVIGSLCLTPLALAQKAGGGAKAGATALGWYDSTGRFVGNAVQGGALATVGGDAVFVPMTMDTFQAYPTWRIGNSGRVWFESTNCVGPAYVSLSSLPGTTKYQAVFANGGAPRLYLAGSAVEPIALPMNSYHDDSNPRTSCTGGTGAGLVVPATGSQELAGVWTPPFTLR